MKIFKPGFCTRQGMRAKVPQAYPVRYAEDTFASITQYWQRFRDILPIAYCKFRVKRTLLTRSIALVTLWIFLFSNVSFALRPVAMKDRGAEGLTRVFYDLRPGNPNEPFWHLVQRATYNIRDNAEGKNKRAIQTLLSTVALDNTNQVLQNETTKQLAAFELADGGKIGEVNARLLVGHAVIIGNQASTAHVSNDEFWRFVKDSLEVDGAELKRMVADMHAEMERGLDDKEPSSLAMIPTYVGPPQGYESGKFGALDVGGTNSRWLSVQLEPGQQPAAKSDGGKKMPAEITHGGGTAEQFFGFIANQGHEFLRQEGLLGGPRLPTGFTWSYAATILAVNKARHDKWSKEINVSGVVGNDPAELLSGNMIQYGDMGNVVITAICNDTVGTFMARAITDLSCATGIILGSGSNACYPELIERIKKWRGTEKPSNSALCGVMLVNMEWGNFGGRQQLKGKPVDQQEKTVRVDPFDVRLDIASERPGDYIYEKQIAGVYMGECLRVRCAEAIKRGLLFNGQSCSIFNEKGAFDTKYLTPIIDDNTSDLSKIDTLLKERGITNSTLQDRKHLRELCLLVEKRAARKSTAGMVAVVTRVEPELRQKRTAAIDGSLFEHHGYFRVEMDAAKVEILGAGKAANLQTVLTRDGSGIGAAVTAAVVSADYFTDGKQVDKRKWEIIPHTNNTRMRNRTDPTAYARRMPNGIWEKETRPASALEPESSKPESGRLTISELREAIVRHLSASKLDPETRFQFVLDKLNVNYPRLGYDLLCLRHLVGEKREIIDEKIEQTTIMTQEADIIRLAFFDPATQPLAMAKGPERQEGMIHSIVTLQAVENKVGRIGIINWLILEQVLKDPSITATLGSVVKGGIADMNARRNIKDVIMYSFPNVLRHGPNDATEESVAKRLEKTLKENTKMASKLKEREKYLLDSIEMAKCELAKLGVPATSMFIDVADRVAYYEDMKMKAEKELYGFSIREWSLVEYETVNFGYYDPLARLLVDIAKEQKELTRAGFTASAPQPVAPTPLQSPALLGAV